MLSQEVQLKGYVCVSVCVYLCVCMLCVCMYVCVHARAHAYMPVKLSTQLISMYCVKVSFLAEARILVTVTHDDIFFLSDLTDQWRLCACTHQEP